MPIDLTWSVLKDLADWALAAKKAARGRAQHRIANIVEHCGTIVSGVNHLNAKVNEMLRPLVYFDPSEWDASRRAKLAEDLILFAEESVVVPRIRAGVSALFQLVIDIDDRDLRDPAETILGIGYDLFLPRRALESDSNRPRGFFGQTGEYVQLYDNSLVLESAVEHLQGPSFSSDWFTSFTMDFDLGSLLPVIIPAIRNARTEREVYEIRTLAAVLTLDESVPTPTTYPVDESAAKVKSILSPYASRLQAEFGRLIAAQQRSFPDMPPPTWAFG